MKLLIIIGIYALGAYLSIFTLLVPGLTTIVDLIQGIDIESSVVVWGIIKAVLCWIPFTIAHIINIFVLAYEPY